MNFIHHATAIWNGFICLWPGFLFLFLFFAGEIWPFPLQKMRQNWKKKLSNMIHYSFFNLSYDILQHFKIGGYGNSLLDESLSFF